MINREIGWSNLNNLTYGVSQQVNKIQKQVCCNCNIPTTTTTSSSSTSTSTSTTTSTSSSTTTTTTTLAPALRFTTDIVPEKQEFCLYIQTVDDGGPAINYVLDFGTGDIGTGSIAAGTSTIMSYTYPLGSYESVMTFDTPARILQFNMNCGSFKINTITGLEYLSGLTNLDLQENNLTTIDVSQNTNLGYLDLSNNLFTDVNNLVFPNSIMYLSLASNQISNFNPINPLPSSLTQLYFNYNQIVTFNPTLPLPSGLQYLFLSDNQMTTAGYTASEPWANAMTVIPGRGTVEFTNNPDSITSAPLIDILTSKGWSVQPPPTTTTSTTTIPPTTTTTTTMALLPFDVTANWSLTTPAVTDEASFRTFLETGRDPSNSYNYLTNLVIAGFSITTISGTQSRIQCDLKATSTSSNYSLRQLQITEINALGNIPIKTSLYLNNNQIPSIVTLSSTPLFSNLQLLNIEYNQLGSTFNSINWPTNLTYLRLRYNNTLSFNPTNPLPSIVNYLDISGNGITGANMNYTKLPTGLTFLNMALNPLGGNFNPSVPLPNGISTLYVEQCQLTSFNPTFNMPSGLISFYAYNNFLTSFDISKFPNTLQWLAIAGGSLGNAVNNYVWPTGLKNLFFTSTGISSFDPVNPLPNGLLQLTLSGNGLSGFNPTLPLPNTVNSLSLNNCTLTTAEYTASEPWANAMSVIPGRGTIYFGSNTNSVSGTNLETILISKGWTLSV